MSERMKDGCERAPFAPFHLHFTRVTRSSFHSLRSGGRMTTVRRKPTKGAESGTVIHVTREETVERKRQNDRE